MDYPSFASFVSGAFLLWVGVWLFATAIHMSRDIDKDNIKAAIAALIILSGIGVFLISVSLMILVSEAIKVTHL